MKGPLAAAAALLCVGAVCLFEVRSERAIAAAQSSAQWYYQRAAENESVARKASLLQRVQHRALADLRRVSENQNSAETTAALLSGIDALAVRRRVVLEETEPAQGAQPLPEAGPAGDPLASVPLTIRFRATFSHTLEFISGLSRQHTLIGVENVDITAIQPASASSGEPVLETTLRATLYRLHVQKIEEAGIASTR